MRVCTYQYTLITYTSKLIFTHGETERIERQMTVII